MIIKLDRDMISEGYVNLDSKEVYEKDLNLLCENLKLILDNANKILDIQKYFYCYPKPAYLSVAYIGADGQIPLGGLILKWKELLLIEECPDCKGKLYMINGGGSPLSGRNSCTGICIGCQKVFYISSKSFSSIRFPMCSIIEVFPNRQIIKKGERKKFSWSHGTIGEDTSDEIIQDSIKGVSLETLIYDLKYQMF